MERADRGDDAQFTFFDIDENRRIIQKAQFGSEEDPSGSEQSPWVVIIARIAAQKLDKKEIELALGGLFELSALYDQA